VDCSQRRSGRRARGDARRRLAHQPARQPGDAGAADGTLRRALATVGRPFPGDAPILKEFRIADSRRAALEESKPYLEPKYRAYADWGLDKPMPKGESLSVPFDDLARDRFIVGTPDECRADIDRHATVLGVTTSSFASSGPACHRRTR